MDDKFNASTKSALIAFKQKHGLSDEEALGSLTYAYLQYEYEQMLYQGNNGALAASDTKFRGRKGKMFTENNQA